MKRKTAIVDLFCGCGGFSLGAHRNGLAPKLAIDVDSTLTSSFNLNFKRTELLLADISKVEATDIVARAGAKIDGVFGGPPCQAFSSIGRRREDDPRRSLLGHFFRLIAQLEPAFFLMENVQGLMFDGMRSVLDDALTVLPGRYTVLGPLILDAAEFGAATQRPRLFVFGFDRARFSALTEADITSLKKPAATVRAAIGDLENAEPEFDDEGWDYWRIKQRGRPSLYASALRDTDGLICGHRRTAHTKQVVARFKKLRPGEKDLVGRHVRLDWESQCPTLRAGTGSDLGSFQSVRPIHPNEPRVITVREGARLQGFPDSFQFHKTIWHSFRMIGNSVSPIISTALFSLIASRFDAQLLQAAE